MSTIPTALLGFLIVSSSCLLALLPYRLARQILHHRADPDSRDLAASILFRVGALHSLILALVFAQELLNFSDARHTMTREASLVGNIFYDLRRYDVEATAPAQANLVAYTDIVLNREWDTLARERRLEDAAWQEWQEAYEGILDLVPDSLRQESLRDIMIGQVRELSQLRLEREATALVGTSHLLIFAAVAGIVIMSIGFFPYAPTRVNLTLLLLFGVYTGLVIFFIVAFSNPFSGASAIQPVRMERLYEGMLNTG